MLHRLDHVVVAVGDLAAASERTAALLGFEPTWRGVHPEAGTANALFPLGNTYLELLAAVGEGPVATAVRAALARGGEGLAALAFGTDDAAAFAAALRARGIAAGEPTSGAGRDDAGTRERHWQTVALPADVARGLFLFAIEHCGPDTLPPAPDVGPAGVHALDHVVITSPDLEAARRLYGGTLGLRLALDRSFERRGVRILFFRVGGVTVEVAGGLAPASAPDAVDRFGGLAWRVADADAARTRLVAAGFDVSGVRPGAKPGTRVCTVRSGTCGVPTLLIEPAR